MQQNPKKAFEMLHASLVNARKAMETQGDANPAALSAIDAGISNVNRALQTAEFYGREFDWGSTAKMFIETFAVCLAFDMAFRGASGKPGGAGATRNKQDAAKKSAPPHRGTAARQDTDAPGGYANAIQPGTARQAKNIGTDAPETPKAGIKTPALKYPRASHEYALGDAFSRCAEFYELGKGHYEKEFARLLRTEFPQTYEFLCQTARNCGFEPNDKSISGLASEMLFAADDGIALDAMAAQLPRTPRYHDITLEVLAQETRIEMAPSAIRFAGADMTNTFKKTLSDMGLSWNDENVSALNRMWQAQVFEDVPLAKSIEDFSRAKGRGRVFSLPEYVEEGYFRKFVLSWHEKKGGVPGAFGGN